MVFYFSVIIIILITLFILEKPAYLIIFAIILSSTFPIITDEDFLSVGSKGFNLRFEYILVFIGFFLSYWKTSKHYKLINTRVIKATKLMIFVHLITLPISLFWGTKFGIGQVIRLTETFLFVIIIVKLTNREDIKKILPIYILIGTIVAFALLLLASTGNTKLFILINGQKKIFNYSVMEGQIFGARIGWLRYSIHAIPIIGVMSLIMFLLSKTRRFLYLLSTIIIFFYSAISGQRSIILVFILGCLMGFFYLYKYKYLKRKNLQIIVLIFLLVLMIYPVFIYSEALSNRLNLLTKRFEKTSTYFYSESQLLGQKIAFNKLNSSGILAWFFGFGGISSSRIGPGNGYDINTPILMIYRFGILGLITCLVFIYQVYKKGIWILKNIRLGPEHLSIVLGTILFSIIWLFGSFIRGMVFSDTFNTLSWYIALVGWIEVIYRDMLLLEKNITPITSSNNLLKLK